MLGFDLISVLDIFARGGGGGSGGGGGGGGGGGSGGSGGGSGIELIFLVGYVPSHFWGRFIRNKITAIPIVAFLVTMLPILFIFLGLAILAFSWVTVLILLGALVGGPSGLYGWFGKVSGRFRKRAKKQITEAASKDPAWDETSLNQRVKQVFVQYQKDWSEFNYENVYTYATQNYAYHAQLMMSAIKLRGRKNLVESPEIIDMFPTDVVDLPDNNADRVTYYIFARANDKIIETLDGQEKVLFTDNNSFSEYWNFVRINNVWMLDSINQLTDNIFSHSSKIQAFANKNNFKYSPDWGWLLIPSRGRLFDKNKFGVSDINNHVIGVYNNLLVELYTYNPSPNDGKNLNYVIAQVALPKRYDSIIVEAKSRLNLFSKTPKGYNKISLEWPDFNKRYNVYATNVEQVTAFELLHPAYMERLFALPFKVSIEVVENVVYLYTTDKNADYEVMYGILQEAFKQMKM